MNKKQKKIIKNLITGASILCASSFLAFNFAYLFNENNNNSIAYDNKNNNFSNESNKNFEDKLRYSRPNNSNYVNVEDETSGITYSTCSVDIPKYLNDTSNFSTEKVYGYKLKIKDVNKFINNPTIRSEINGYPLISIDNAFMNLVTLTTPPVLPNTILSMNNAFSGCTGLKTLPNIPTGIMYLENAFYGCTNVTTQNLRIPSSVISMTNAFYNCSNLNCDLFIQSIKLRKDQLNLPTITSINNAFYGASKIKSVSFSDPITYYVRNKFGFSGNILQSISQNQTYTTNVSSVSNYNYPWLYAYMNSCDINSINFLNFLNINGINRFDAEINGQRYKKTTFSIEQFNYDLQKGECTFEISKTNYFDGSGNYCETPLNDKTVYKLTGFVSIQDETRLVNTKTLDKLPSEINESNWNKYFAFQNTPSNNIEYIFVNANAKDYDPNTRKSSLTLEVQISKYFDNVSGKLSLITTPKIFRITIESDIIQNPTQCEQATDEQIISRNLQPKNEIYPSEVNSNLISNYLTFQNLPDSSKIKVVVKNKDTLNRDGFIKVDVYLTKWYRSDNGLLATQSDAGWDSNNLSNSQPNFTNIVISGFKSISGPTSLTSTNIDLTKMTAEQFKNEFNDLTWNKFVQFNNLPPNSSIINAQVINWDNTNGTATIKITISSYFNNNYEYINQNNSYSYTFSNFKIIEANGETTIVPNYNAFIEWTRTDYKYPSQIQKSDIESYIRIENSYSSTSGNIPSTELIVNDPVPNDEKGTIEVTVELKNRLVNNGNGWVVDPTTIIQTLTFECFYNTNTINTTIRPRDIRGQDVPSVIEPYEFNKYFEVVSPLYGQQPKADIEKDNNGNIISGNISTINNWLVINSIHYYPDKGAVVADVTYNKRIVNGELVSNQNSEKIYNLSFTSNSTIDRGDGWQNGTNWMWFIIGISIAFAVMLIVIAIICIVFGITRRNYECSQKKAIHMWNPSSTLPSNTSALSYENRPQLSTSQNTTRQIEHRPIQQHQKHVSQKTTTRTTSRS